MISARKPFVFALEEKEISAVAIPLPNTFPFSSRTSIGNEASKNHTPRASPLITIGKVILTP